MVVPTLRLCHADSILFDEALADVSLYAGWKLDSRQADLGEARGDDNETPYLLHLHQKRHL